MSAFPDGFVPHDRKSPVTDAWQPLWSRVLADRVEIGFEVGENHCNGRGLLHGGVLAALADNAMGMSLGHVVRAGKPDGGAPSGIVTTNLNLDFVGMSRPGQPVIIIPRVVHAGRGSGVVEAIVTSDGAVIARANATFRILSGGLEQRSINLN